MIGSMKKILVVVTFILVVAVFVVGCSGSQEQNQSNSGSGETVVQLPAVSAGDSNGDAGENDAAGVEYPEPVAEIEPYPEPVEEVAVEEVEAYPEPVVDAASNVYPEPEETEGGIADERQNTIPLKTAMSATLPGQIDLATGEPQVIEFFAYWCPTCQALAPTIHALEVEYYPDIKFSYLDIDNPAYDEYKDELGYRYQPHIFLLDGEGNIVEQWVGLVSEDVFRVSLDELLNN